MKWIVCIFFGLCLQSIVSHPQKKFVSFEDNSLYFKKGVYADFLNDQLVRLRETQAAHPGLVFQLTLVQLESEPRSLADKRYKTVIKHFQGAGLDMNRIVFDSKAIYVKAFENYAFTPPLTMDSIGAILEGKVLLID
jgi:hypothetical protein